MRGAGTLHTPHAVAHAKQQQQHGQAANTPGWCSLPRCRRLNSRCAARSTSAGGLASCLSKPRAEEVCKLQAVAQAGWGLKAQKLLLQLAGQLCLCY